MITRAAIIGEARTWIGTPYHHQASVRGVGCDCVGLVRGVWRAVIGPEPEELPAYSRDWGDADGKENIIAMGLRHLIQVPNDQGQPGDVIALRWKDGRVAKHVMILSYDDKAIHAYNGSPVSEVPLSDWWKRKIVMTFQYPGVE